MKLENVDIEDVEQSLLIFRSALNETAPKVLVQDRKEHKPWISKETIDLIMKRGELQLKKNSCKAEAFSETNLTYTKSNKAEVLIEIENCCKLVQKAVREDDKK